MATVTEAVSLEQAAKAAETKKAANRKKNQVTRSKALKEGDRLQLPCIFEHANGKATEILVKTSVVRTLGLYVVTDQNGLRVAGSHVEVLEPGKTKLFHFSFGSKIVKRKIKGKTTEKYARVWQSMSVPDNATQVDLLFFMKTWSKRPEIIRIGKAQLVVGKTIKNISLKKYNPVKAIIKAA